MSDNEFERQANIMIEVFAVCIIAILVFAVLLNLLGKKDISEDVNVTYCNHSIVIEETEDVIPIIDKENKFNITSEEFELLAKVVMGEAGNQEEIGQRLVIDTVLNRVNDNRFPDTIYEVLTQPNQYYVNESIIPSPEIYGYIYDELIKLYNEEVLYFRTSRYHNNTEPLFVIGAHYFSK